MTRHKGCAGKGAAVGKQAPAVVGEVAPEAGLDQTRKAWTLALGAEF